MEFKDFNQIIEQAKNKKAMKPMAVAAADESHSLEAAIKAYKEKVVQPFLVGDKEKILSIIKSIGETFPEEYIIDAPDRDEAAFQSVKLVREGKCSFIMKGILETSQIIKA
ncbi:MAG: phosphate butyryltransferase, partial [Deltaproteobacteria bacterium]|nr:phosphate butyryltransferase [Deltaproteobacteria bacterium]